MIFRYPGSKARFRNQIMRLAPANYGEYREPFIGGGSVFFGIRQDIPRWINDRNSDLIQVYLALRDRPVEFIEACRKIKPLEPGENPERLKAIFDHFAADLSIDTALRFYFLQRTTWGGIVDRIYAKPSFQSARGWKIVQGDRLWRAAGRLQGTTVTAGDYLPLLQAPGNDVWLYCDPCYYVNNELAKSKWLYRHIFTEQQHVEFARHVRACSHKVLISYDDHPFIRSLYCGLNIYHADPIRYQLNGKEGRELFITNY